MMKNDYRAYRDYQIHQPFFSFDVLNYREKMVATPYGALFYEFTTNQVIDRSNELFMTCIPDGCVDIVFIRNHQTYKIEFIGSPFCHKSLIVYPSASYFGVRLMPGMFFPYDTMRVKEITNTETFVPQISPELETLMDSFFQAENLEHRVELFFRYLQNYAPDEFMVNETVQSILYLISRSKGGLEIGEIAEQVCYSERHLTRIFSDTLGYSPKMFSRISRFQYALGTMMADRHSPISSFITSLNYADQAHFQREFKEFTGLTPKHFSQRFVQEQ